MIDVEYEGNHAYCSFCGLLGHTVGLCRKKRQIQGKAPMDNQKEHTDIPTHKGHVKDHTQWVSKKTTGGENLAIHTNNPPEILKRTEHGIDELTRQNLVKTGLVTDANEPSNTNEDQGSKDKENQEQTNDYHKPPNPNNLPGF